MKNLSITKWALIRRNELVDVPEDYTIHQEFCTSFTEVEMRTAFDDIHQLFYDLYTKMAEDPAYFSFPLYEVGEFDMFSKEEQGIRKKPWDIFYVLMALLISAHFTNGRLIVSVSAFLSNCKVKGIPVYLEILADYGFVFTGLKNGKLPKKEETITVEYPDNQAVLELLFLVANKVVNVQLHDEKNLTAMDVVYRNAFISWNYRVLQDGLQKMTPMKAFDYVGDKLHSKEEHETIEALHNAITDAGYICKLAGRNEGPCIRYYKGSADTYSFGLNEVEGHLQLELRIRKIDKCHSLPTESGEHIKEMFLKSDYGCQNRRNGTCRSSIHFEMDGEERWHCGCCGAPFQIAPVIEEIPVYLQLVMLGK